MIHFGLPFVKGVWSLSRLIFLHVNIQLFQHHLLKTIFNHCLIFAPLSKISIFMWVNFWALYPVPLIFLSTVYYRRVYCNFVVSLAVG